MDARQGLAAILRDAVLRTAPQDDGLHFFTRSVREGGKERLPSAVQTRTRYWGGRYGFSCFVWSRNAHGCVVRSAFDRDGSACVRRQQVSGLFRGLAQAVRDRHSMTP